MAQSFEGQMMRGIRNALRLDAFNIRGDHPAKLVFAFLRMVAKGKDWGADVASYRADKDPTQTNDWIMFLTTHKYDKFVVYLPVNPVSKRMYQASLMQIADFQITDVSKNKTIIPLYKGFDINNKIFGVDIPWNYQYYCGRKHLFEDRVLSLFDTHKLERNETDGSIFGLLTFNHYEEFTTQDGRHRLFGDISMLMDGRSYIDDSVGVQEHGDPVGMQSMIFINIKKYFFYIWIKAGQNGGRPSYSVFDSINTFLASNVVCGLGNIMGHIVVNFSFFPLDPSNGIRNKFILNQTHQLLTRLHSNARHNAIMWSEKLLEFEDSLWGHSLYDPQIINESNYQKLVGFLSEDSGRWRDTKRRTYIKESVDFIEGLAVPLKLKWSLLIDSLVTAFARSTIIGIYDIEYKEIHANPKV